MDIDAVAKEMRERIFDRAEDDKCLHASSVEDVIKDVLRKVATPQYPSFMTGPAHPVVGEYWKQYVASLIKR